MENRIVMDCDNHTVLIVGGRVVINMFVTFLPNSTHVQSDMAQSISDAPHATIARSLLQSESQTIDNFRGGNLLPHLSDRHDTAETYDTNYLAVRCWEPQQISGSPMLNEASTSREGFVPNDGKSRADSGGGGDERSDPGANDSDSSRSADMSSSESGSGSSSGSGGSNGNNGGDRNNDDQPKKHFDAIGEEEPQDEDENEEEDEETNRGDVDSQLEQESSMEWQDVGDLPGFDSPVRSTGTPVYDEDRELALILSCGQTTPIPYCPVKLSEVNDFFAHEYKPTPIISKGKRPPYKHGEPRKDLVKRSKKSNEKEMPDLLAFLELRRIVVDTNISPIASDPEATLSDESLLPQVPQGKSDPLIGSSALMQDVYDYTQPDTAIDATKGPRPRLRDSFWDEVQREGAEAARLRHYVARSRSPLEPTRPINVAPYPYSEPPPFRYCEPVNVPKKHLLHLIQIYKQDRVRNLSQYDTMQGPSGTCEGSYGPIEELCYRWDGRDRDYDDDDSGGQEVVVRRPSGQVAEQSGPASGRAAPLFGRPSTSRDEVGIDLSTTSQQYPFKNDHYAMGSDEDDSDINNNNE